MARAIPRLSLLALLVLPAVAVDPERPALVPGEGVEGQGKEAPPSFQPVQPSLFAAPGGQPNAWADYDNDGDLDLYVGFRGGVRSRLYRNDAGRFTDVASALGIDDSVEVRAAAWGDVDGDGHLDLYIGFTPAAAIPNRLYRNPGRGGRFVDIAVSLGVAERGTTRQPVFLDVDQDGDTDLFVAFRDRPNALYRNDGGRLVDVAPSVGLADPRKTVGVVWWDWEQDGDLDLFVANQEGDANGFYRNVGGRWVDVADSLGLSERGRPADRGGVGPALGDFDNDGDLDLFVANYGPDALYRDDRGRFTNVAEAMGLGGDYHSTSAAWGDMDHDGRLDLYVVSYLAGERDTPDHFFKNAGTHFIDVMPATVAANNGSHGVAWADFDRDGDLDLALTNNHAAGTHPLYRNGLARARAERSLQVAVRDSAGRATAAGSEVRVFAAGTRQLLGLRLVDTGGGYDSQGAAPVHFGLPSLAPVDVEVTVLTRGGRITQRVVGVNPRAYRTRSLEVRVAALGGARGAGDGRAAVPAAPAQPLGDMARVAFLAGCWELRTPSRVTHEQWMAPLARVMLGMSRTVVRDTVREWESLRIERRDGVATYVAQPGGRAPTYFAATALADGAVTFANPQHDFPQRIIYRRLTRDSLLARIEGEEGGTTRGIDFRFRRTDCVP